MKVDVDGSQKLKVLILGAHCIFFIGTVWFKISK